MGPNNSEDSMGGLKCGFRDVVVPKQTETIIFNSWGHFILYNYNVLYIYLFVVFHRHGSPEPQFGKKYQPFVELKEEE